MVALSSVDVVLVALEVDVDAGTEDTVDEAPSTVFFGAPKKAVILPSALGFLASAAALSRLVLFGARLCSRQPATKGDKTTLGKLAVGSKGVLQKGSSTQGHHARKQKRTKRFRQLPRAPCKH